MKPKFKLGQIVWSMGLAIRGAGTQNPKGYYLPLKHKIWEIKLKLYHDNNVEYDYTVLRPRELEKRTKTFKLWKNTNSYWCGGHNNICGEKYLSKSKQKILKICNKINQDIKNYK
jgi:hypothetical protein